MSPLIILAILAPWVLTTVAILIIMAWRKKSTPSGDAEGFGFMDEYDEEDTIRVAVYDDKAYWVYQNVFYESEVVREPDFTTARPIDTMDLASKDLAKLLSILDELEQRNNERE